MRRPFSTVPVCVSPENSRPFEYGRFDASLSVDSHHVVSFTKPLQQAHAVWQYIFPIWVYKTHFMWAQEYSKPNDKVTFMNTLTACVNKVVKDGYTDSFKVTRQGLYSCAKSRYYTPSQVKVINYYRFEGESDPADMSIMYVIETADGIKGTLIDAFGTYADESVNAFMKEVEDIHKKTDKSE